MDTVIQDYYKNNAEKLHNEVDRILRRFGGWKDVDDFYSAANEAAADARRTFDGSRNTPFEAYLRKCVEFAVMDEITRRNRGKRRRTLEIADGDGKETVYVDEVSLDMPLEAGDGRTLADTVASAYDAGQEENAPDGRIEAYLNSLSEVQRRMVTLRGDGYTAGEIKRFLGLTDRQYEDYWKAATAYDRTKGLRRSAGWEGRDGGGLLPVEEEAESVSGRTREMVLPVYEIVNMLAEHSIRDDHPLHRAGGQWNRAEKSGLISDILQGRTLTQIILSEEDRDGVTLRWLVDGKQRCNIMDEFIHDGFSVSGGIQVFQIPYRTEKVDRDGNIIFDDDGVPVPEDKVFDIRRKKFSQLPDELRDRFLEYRVRVMLNLKCTEEETAYDMARFNRCRGMSAAQNGWMGMDETFAGYIDKILELPFFQVGAPNSSYRGSNNRSGRMRKMVAESIMVSEYIEDFQKDFGRMCVFLSENARDSDFTGFYSRVERLDAVLSRDTAVLFNIRDSFLWFGLFSRFCKLGLEDGRFTGFLTEFLRTPRFEGAEGETYYVMGKKSAGDKKNVVQSLNMLENLMKRYLSV